MVRVVALLIVVVVVVSVSSVGGAWIAGGGTGFALVALFLLEWVYGIAFEWALRGRTPGKLALSLRVVRVDGSPGRLRDYVLRNLLRGVDYLPVLPLLGDLVYLPTFGVGVLTMVLDPRQRRIGDLVAGTLVVIEDRGLVLGRVKIEPPVSAQERRALPPRVDLTPEEIRVIEAFLRRRRQLSDERAEELAWLFGPTLSARTGVRADRYERVLALAYARATGKDRPDQVDR